MGPEDLWEPELPCPPVAPRGPYSRRPRPSLTPSQRLTALALTALIHGLLVLMLWAQFHWPTPTPSTMDTPLQVVYLTAPPKIMAPKIMATVAPMPMSTPRTPQIPSRLRPASATPPQTAPQPRIVPPTAVFVPATATSARIDSPSPPMFSTNTWPPIAPTVGFGRQGTKDILAHRSVDRLLPNSGPHHGPIMPMLAQRSGANVIASVGGCLMYLNCLSIDYDDEGHTKVGFVHASAFPDTVCADLKQDLASADPSDTARIQEDEERLERSCGGQ